MKRTPKQIAALFCVLLLVLLYIALLVFALFDFPGADRLFRISLFATIALPLLLWIYIWLYGVLKEKHTIASLDIFEQSEEDKRILAQAIQEGNAADPSVSSKDSSASKRDCPSENPPKLS